jgi:O-antigen/teichoic acid export membrane protein
MERYAITLFADKAISLVGVLLLPVPYDQDPVSVIGCYALSSLVVSLWAIASLSRTFLLSVRFPLEVIADIWRFSIPVILSTWSGLIGTQWVQYAIIKEYLPFSEIGLYSLASQVSGAIQQIAIIVSSLLLPHFSVMVAKDQGAEVRTMIEKVVPYGCLGFSIFLSMCALASGVVIPHIFGKPFSESVLPLILLLVATMGLALYSMFMSLMYAHGFGWVVTIITIASAAVSFAAALGLIPRYGINGAALATVLGYITAAGMMLAVTQWRLGLPTLRLGFLGLPIASVAFCALLLHDVYFYLTALGGIVISTSTLVYKFGLLRKDVLAVLAEVKIPLMVRAGLMRVWYGKVC